MRFLQRVLGRIEQKVLPPTVRVFLDAAERDAHTSFEGECCILVSNSQKYEYTDGSWISRPSIELPARMVGAMDEVDAVSVVPDGHIYKKDTVDSLDNIRRDAKACLESIWRNSYASSLELYEIERCMTAPDSLNAVLRASVNYPWSLDATVSKESLSEPITAYEYSITLHGQSNQKVTISGARGGPPLSVSDPRGVLTLGMITGDSEKIIIDSTSANLSGNVTIVLSVSTVDSDDTYTFLNFTPADLMAVPSVDSSSPISLSVKGTSSTSPVDNQITSYSYDISLVNQSRTITLSSGPSSPPSVSDSSGILLPSMITGSIEDMVIDSVQADLWGTIVISLTVSNSSGSHTS